MNRKNVTNGKTRVAKAKPATKKTVAKTATVEDMRNMLDEVIAKEKKADEEFDVNWEDRYNPDLLRSGFLLYKQGKTKQPVKTGDVYKVKVRDNSYYYTERNVLVSKIGGKYSAKCDCWDCRGGAKCQHEVAAIYAILKPLAAQSSSGNKKMLTVKQRKQSGGYHYFDMDKIAGSITIMQDQYQKAQELLKQGVFPGGRITSFFYHDDSFKNYNGMVCRVTERQPAGDFPQYAELTVGKDFVWKANCNFRRCYCHYDRYDYSSNYNESQLCEHLLAALITLDDYVEDENPGDETDLRAQKFLGRFRRQNHALSEKAANVFLEPELQNDDGELKAGFKIGIEKAFKVKNLTELVEKAENNETLTLGKTGAVNFALNEFDEKSKPLFAFIQSRVKDAQQRNERNAARRSMGYFDRYADEKITNAILLEGTAMDEFYNLCGGFPEIPYSHKIYRGGTTKGKLRCALGMPKTSISIKELRDGGQAAGITVSGKLPEMQQGAKGIYCVDGNFLYKSSEEEYDRLRPLTELADQNGYFSFTVGRRYLAEFYHSVYPMLEEVAKIDDQAIDRIEKYVPPVPEFAFYLDSENSILTCRAQVSYGDTKHSPMEVMGRNQFAQIYRDYQKEREACDTVKEFFPVYDPAREESVCDDPDEAFRIYQEGVDALLGLGEIHCTDRFQSRRVRKNFGVKFGVSVESDLLNLDLTSGELSKEELIDVFNSYRLKKKYHVLRNGDFLDLESPDIQMLDQILSACRIDLKDIIGDKIKLPMYRALYLDRLLEDNEELYSHRDRNFRKTIKEFGTIKDSDLEVPASLENTLRPYQVFGHKWLRTILQNGFGGILADEMGLGKTLQIISVLLAEKKEQPEPALIVCPASLVYNWKEEFSRFAPELSVETVAGGIKERREQIRNYQKTDVLITSYDLLKRDIAEYQDLTFTYQILDEAQYVKNARTVAAKTVKVIQSKHRFALTGTPIENRLSELWSIFDFLMPGFLYDYETFRRELETPITKEKDEDASQRLKKMIAPFVLRRLKKDVLKDLPDKIEELRYGVMEEEQKKLYDAQVLRITKKIDQESEEEFKKNKLRILAEITRTRQICCDPSLVMEDYKGGSAKREACLDLIQSAIEGEHRILLFSQFTSMLDLLEEDLKANGIEYYKLTGDTPKEERIRLMKTFNEGDVPVFLISLKAGGTGLNLTGADVVIHYDPWWNLAVQNQATDRAHRIGQTQKVTVYKLIIKGSIEEKIVKLQESKKDLAEEVLSGENGTLTSMSKADLLELLG